MKPISQLSDADFELLARQAVALPDAPQTWVERACSLFAQTGSLSQVAGAALALVRAVLSFDSWAPAPAGMAVRSVPSDTRHLVFSAMGRDIDLRIVPTPGHYLVSGQILGPDETGRVELAAATEGELTTPGPARFAALDAMGEFRLDGVPGGRYQLTLHLKDEQVLLPPIEIGARRP
ncbi:MAG: hypothetical protein JNK55_11015 [Rubrivivax sp.]|nr:hypothetical protein [Rubrivivax sp.]